MPGHAIHDYHWDDNHVIVWKSSSNKFRPKTQKTIWMPLPYCVGLKKTSSNCSQILLPLLTNQEFMVYGLITLEVSRSVFETLSMESCLCYYNSEPWGIHTPFV